MSDQELQQGGFSHEAAALPTIGDLLRRAREARGESPADVAHALKLSQRQIEAMELERFDLLPGPAFVRGFLRNYSRYLGLHLDDQIAQLQFGEPAQVVRLAPVTNATGDMPTGGGGQRRVVRPAMVVVVGMLVVLIAGWYFDWFAMSEVETVATAPLATGSGAPSGSSAPPPPRPSSATPIPPPTMSVPSTATMSVPGADTEAPVASRLVEGVPQSESPTAEVASEVEAESSLASTSPLQASSSQPEAGATPAPGADAAAAGGPAGQMSATDQTAAASSSDPSVAQATALVAPPPAATSPNVEVVGDLADGEGSRLVFSLRGESWIQVRDGEGAALFTGTGAPGTTRIVQGKPPFAIVVGNAGLVSVEFDGEPVDLTPHIRGSGVARMTIR